VKRFRLITDQVLGAFARSVYANQRRVRRVWILSPWLGSVEDADDALLLLIDALRNRSCPIVLITRPPDAAWHLRAIQLLQSNCAANVFLHPNLHTKLYIAECDGFRCAVLGSPNLTPRSLRQNREIAIEFRTTVESSEDDVAALLTELTEYASSLRGDAACVLM
jgi:phosphatidylserine/phosphatidylglycerophosphate/cardiolipin synthase-like enzyme